MAGGWGTGWGAEVAGLGQVAVGAYGGGGGGCVCGQTAP